MSVRVCLALWRARANTCLREPLDGNDRSTAATRTSGRQCDLRTHDAELVSFGVGKDNP